MRLLRLSIMIALLLGLSGVTHGEVVWLDFAGTPWPTFAGKSASDFENAALAIIQADYADYDYLTFTTINPGGSDFTQIEFRESGGTNEVGEAHIIDWGNKLLYQNNINQPNNTQGAALDVYVTGFTEYGGPFTDSFENITRAVGTTASHEMGHALGLRHFDTFGPSVVAGNPNPVADHHIMATRSTGLSAIERVAYDRVFSDHSADKLAYLDPANMPSRTRDELMDPYMHDTIATAEDLTIGPADILPQTGRMAMTKVATLFPGESDFYYIDARAGDGLYANLFSERLSDEDGIGGVMSIDTVIRLYDPTGALVYVNDDTGYSSTSAVDGGIGDAIWLDAASGDSPFESFTTDSILLDSPTGDFFTLDSTGRWTIEVDALDDNDAGYYELFVVAVPEPATLTVLAIGSTAMLRRRRRVAS